MTKWWKVLLFAALSATLAVGFVLAAGDATVTNGHLLTDAQVEAYSNNTMTLLYSTKISGDVKFTQALAGEYLYMVSVSQRAVGD